MRKSRKGKREKKKSRERERESAYDGCEKRVGCYNRQSD